MYLANTPLSNSSNRFSLNFLPLDVDLNYLDITSLGDFLQHALHGPPKPE
jgi:hypothetical protein